MNTRDPVPSAPASRYDAYWTRLSEATSQHDLFHVLRWLDALSGANALIGRASHPREEPVRLGQEPSLCFAPSLVATAAAQTRPGVPARVTIHGLGLFGPNGPLPHHLTEHARERAKTFGDATLTAFADIFHHRLIALFYRAWADAQVVVDHDRPGPARIDAYIANLIGKTAVGSEGEGRLTRHTLYFHAGHWVRQTRNPSGLAHMLSADFGVPARIEEHIVHWMRVDERARTTLNACGPHARLGAGAMLGRAVRDAQSRFRIVLGPMSHARYCSFLPGGKHARRLAQWAREYVGAEFAWEVQLELAADEVPRHALGGTERLGQSMWLGKRMSREPARDLRLDLVARGERARFAR
ncbi:type VI secretion system baseplate subunit TssG [Trinickia fusca]|uniref:Type VI secretion system baseplate subunit TssG n=1 Tax=Trinickia fusca TaxID=2419777 RepID=A0A494X8E8_9BURK|nr:type VI secretion system baseplate subunit TssG [Trinickia fusca]RKP44636.1 type VI secretion system baseplate subunit TssG [Trinickia fusca]